MCAFANDKEASRRVYPVFEIRTFDHGNTDDKCCQTEDLLQSLNGTERLQFTSIFSSLPSNCNTHRGSQWCMSLHRSCLPTTSLSKVVRGSLGTHRCTAKSIALPRRCGSLMVSAFLDRYKTENSQLERPLHHTKCLPKCKFL